MAIYNIAPQARVGSQSLRGREGGGEEEPRSDASSQVEAEVSEPPPFLIFLKSIWCCCAMSFLSLISSYTSGYLLRARVPRDSTVP
jgi:hypothetical protein